MSALDLDALEAKAREATPGPWAFTDYEGSTHVWCGRHMSSMVADNHTEGAIARVRGFGAGLPIVENAAFIAACDPTTVRALITRLRAAESATTPVRLRARRLALGMDVLAATRLVAKVLDARPTWLEAVQQSKAAFLEASLMALEDGTFHGDPSQCVAAYDAVLRAAEARTVWQPIETAGWTCQDEGEFELHTHQADAIAEHFEVHDIDPADESATITVYEHAVIPHEVNVLAWVREHEPEWLPAAPEAP